MMMMMVMVVVVVQMEMKVDAGESQAGHRHMTSHQCHGAQQDMDTDDTFHTTNQQHLPSPTFRYTF